MGAQLLTAGALLLLLLLQTGTARSVGTQRIINDGKPFYVARDPYTGAIDFSTRTDGPNELLSDVGSGGRPYFHKTVDVVHPSYPLISSSYANTKVQGHGGNHVPGEQRRPQQQVMLSGGHDFTIPDTTTRRTTTVTTSSPPPSPPPPTEPSSTTTRRPYVSIFQHLFGDYDNLQENGGEGQATAATSSSTSAPPQTVTSDSSLEDQAYDEDEYDEYGPLQSLGSERETQPPAPFSVSTSTTTTTTSAPATSATAKVTSMPLGDNHPTLGPRVPERQHVQVPVPAAAATAQVQQQYHHHHHHHLQQQQALRPAPSTSSIHIPPDQDVVSFVVGNRQSVGDPTQQARPPQPSPPPPPPPSAVRPVTFMSDSFRPLYSYGPERASAVVMTTNTSTQEAAVEDAATAQPETVRFPQRETPERQVLSLYSRPMLHQLPSDLTPPSGGSGNGRQPSPPPPPPPSSSSQPARPPWDPRPGHFHLGGRPEYSQAPRPQPPTRTQPPSSSEAHKRIDSGGALLPNILPQFRPNMRGGPPPPPPPPAFFGGRLPPPPLPPQPPRIPAVADRRSGIDPHQHHHQQQQQRLEVATLQMIQSKKAPPPQQKNKKNPQHPAYPPQQHLIRTHQQQQHGIVTATRPTAATERPLYVVYPVKMDVISAPSSSASKDGVAGDEAVVVGVRGEQLPLPPSRIAQEPVLRPQVRQPQPPPPPAPPSRPSFPYAMERPDPERARAPASTSAAAAAASEVTLSAVMHAATPAERGPPPRLDFQAPFQASVSAGSQGWSAAAPLATTPAADTSSSSSSSSAQHQATDRKDDADGGAAASNNNFDADSFAPQLYGGFRPIYRDAPAATVSAPTDADSQL